MSDANYKEAVKELLMEHFQDEHGDLGSDWELTDEEVDTVLSIHANRNTKLVKMTFSEVVQECFRIETDTNRPMHQGHVCYGGQAYFIEPEDALNWLNRDEHTYNNLQEAYDDNVGTDWECYYTEWH